MATRGKDVTFKERKIIKHLLSKGDSTRSIALSIGRAFSTVSMEIKRGGGSKNYSPRRSQRSARRRLGPIKTVISDDDRVAIRRMLKKGETKLNICAKLNLSRGRLYEELKAGGWPEEYSPVIAKTGDHNRVFETLRKFWSGVSKKMFKARCQR